MCRSEESFENQKWTLHARPESIFSPKYVKLETEQLHPQVSEKDVIVQVETLSVDAFIRTMLDEEAYHGSIKLGQVLPAIGYGTIVAAGNKSGRKVGSRVAGLLGAQTYSTVAGSEVQPMFQLPYLPLSASLGLMGLTTGLTAYTGMFFVCKPPRRQETVVVTAAAGAVGCIAAQLAKTTGARVIGIAGGDKKNVFLKDELKLDGTIDYKSKEKTVAQQLDELCPDGIDFVYDNVGGEILDELLHRIRPKGRVVICGAVSQYSGNLNKGKVRGPSNYLKLAERGAEMKGFNVMQHFLKIPIALFWMYVYWLRGKVFMPEHVETGIKSFPSALEKLFTGGHVGKMLVQVKE